MKLERIEAIDILRGYFILAIIIVHLSYFPNGYDLITGRGQLWVTNSEGFFFLSGTLIGLVRGRKAISKPFKVVATKLASRGFMLYAWTIGLTFLFTAVALVSQLNTVKPGVWQGAIDWYLIRDTLLFRYEYSWADFLQYYSVYLLFSIPAVLALRKNKAWIILVVSIFLWAVNSKNNAFYNWQLFFFCGAVAGWYWQQILDFLKKTPRMLVLAHYPLAIGMFILNLVVLAGIYPELSAKLSPYFVRAEMPLARVLLFGLWFSALYRFVVSHEHWFKKWVGWLLIPFGQNSLYAYIVHAFLVFFVQLFFVNKHNVILNFIVTSAVILLVWYATKKRFLFGIIPR
jgi:hypothetical protein